MKQLIFCMALALLCVACHHKLTDAEKADIFLQKAQAYLSVQDLNAAKTELDSVHLLFPNEETKRREAKHLADSIAYLESISTLAYCDTMLLQKQHEVDSLMLNFCLQKEEQYQDKGYYVHKLLRTGNNAQRSYMQAYITEDNHVFLKSTYCGTLGIGHTQVRISAGGLSVDSSQPTGNHAFASGSTQWEMLTFQDKPALDLLQFIAENYEEQTQVELSGDKGSYRYGLSTNERTALYETYRLAIAMHDVEGLQRESRKAANIIAKFTAQ